MAPASFDKGRLVKLGTMLGNQRPDPHHPTDEGGNSNAALWDLNHFVSAAQICAAPGPAIVEHPARKAADNQFDLRAPANRGPPQPKPETPHA
jgi:hypothetical protein